MGLNVCEYPFVKINRRVFKAAAGIKYQFGDLGQAMKCALRQNDTKYATRLMKKFASILFIKYTIYKP